MGESVDVSASLIPQNYRKTRGRRVLRQERLRSQVFLRIYLDPAHQASDVAHQLLVKWSEAVVVS
jgi:hypothetical protein